MEKRKDIDMLRFYGGDIHQKNKEGEYVITNNLVNPKNKEDVLWGDRDAYRTLNALLFDGIENEKERIYKEKRKLNPVFIELIENTLEIYRGIFAVMCRKKGNQLSVSKVKRVDRKASLMAYLKGHTESFVSCTNGEYDDEFASKNNIILLEIESLENTPYVDYQQVITMQEYCNYDEKEVLFPPFLSLNVSEIELTTKDPVLLKKIGDKYNYIFIDEYQDTSSYVLDIFYDAVKNRENVQIYLFGDRMQQIYRNYDGSFEGKLKEFDTSDRLEVNFRSIGKIVSILNNIYNDSSFEQQPTESNANVVPDIEPHVIISSNVPESIYKLQNKLC